MTFLFLVLCGVGGILIHLVPKFRDEVTKIPKNGNTFKERLNIVWSKFNSPGNLSGGIEELVFVILFVVIRKSVMEILPITYFTAVFVGYLGDTTINGIKPKEKPTKEECQRAAKVLTSLQRMFREILKDKRK